MDRRNFLISTAGMGAGSLVAAAQTPLAGQPAAAQRATKIKKSVTQGVFGRGMAFEVPCKLAADLGFKGYDLRRPADWPTLRKYGLVSTMAYGASPARGGGGAGGGGAPGAPGGS